MSPALDALPADELAKPASGLPPTIKAGDRVIFVATLDQRLKRFEVGTLATVHHVTFSDAEIWVLSLAVDGDDERDRYTWLRGDELALVSPLSDKATP